MKVVSNSLRDHLKGEVLTLCWCWRLSRNDGKVMGFTTLDQSIEIDGLTYLARTGFFPNAVENSSSLEVNNTELNSIIDDDSISEIDLYAGKYDYARLDLFLVNYLNLPNSLDDSPPNHLQILSGIFGKVSHDDRSFTVEYRSKLQLLTQQVVEQTSPPCRATFGDERCQLNLGPLTRVLTVQDVADNRIITITGFNERDNFFANGTLEFLNGGNNGFTISIQRSTNSTIHLFEKPPFPIASGDRFRAVAGCDYTEADCIRYGNIINFQGEPDLPGVDEILAGFSET